MRKRAMRRMAMAAATVALCVAVMGVAAMHGRTPGDEGTQAVPASAVASPLGGVRATDGTSLREEAGMFVAGIMLIGAAAAVRRAA